jgi:hypothetical protein
VVLNDPQEVPQLAPLQLDVLEGGVVFVVFKFFAGKRAVLERLFGAELKQPLLACGDELLGGGGLFHDFLNISIKIM